MKFKKLMLVACLLLAILTIGAVSAQDDVLAVNDTQEEVLDTPIEETIVSDGADEALSYNASDFNVEINETVDLSEEDAAAIIFEAPSDADGEIWVELNSTGYNQTFELDCSPITVSELDFESVGLYHVNVWFYPYDDTPELFLASGIINVIQSNPGSSFDTGYEDSSEDVPISKFGDDIYWLYDCPVDGRLIILVNGNAAYNVSASEGDDITVKGSDLGISSNGNYDIWAMFNTGDNQFTLDRFVAYYATSYISIYKEIDIAAHNFPIAFVWDADLLNGTVTLSIDGRQCYSEKFNASQFGTYVSIDKVVGIKIDEDFIGNHTVGVTYNDLVEESPVSVVFLPYYLNPFYVAIGESSYIAFKTSSKSTGSVGLYYAVYNNETEDWERGNLIGNYVINGSTLVPLPVFEEEGYYVFCVNGTIDGSNNQDFFRVDIRKNSNNLTSSISSSEIGINDTATIKVTGPKRGWIDFIVDGDYVGLTFSMKNGTVEYTFSNLTKGKHWICAYYDNNGSDEFYSNSFIITVKDVTPAPAPAPVLIDISKAKVKLSKTSFTFNGKVQKPTIKTIGGKTLKQGTDYTVKWSKSSSKNVGTYTITITGKGEYTGTTKVTYKINKAANTLKVSAKTAKVKYSKLKKKTQTLAVSKVIKFNKKGKGTTTYAKKSGNKKITINKKTGKVTVKKGLKKGTYKVKVKVKSGGNSNYKASGYKTVTIKIKVA